MCIVHLTFWGFMESRQDYFTLLSHSKQEDRTEEAVLHKVTPHHLQIQRGSLTSSRNGVWTCSYTAAQVQLTNEKSVTNSMDMAAAYITSECSFISFDILFVILNVLFARTLILKLITFDSLSKFHSLIKVLNSLFIDLPSIFRDGTVKSSIPSYFLKI